MISNTKITSGRRAPARKEFTRVGTGFTLIETLVAISLLTVAIVAPMGLTAQSLSAAYYARDQITAYYLAQEGIEVVRSVRDGNVLENALGQQANLLDYNGKALTDISPFTVDTLVPIDQGQAIRQCPTADPKSCPPLDSDGNVYGYNSNWAPTRFTRYITATTLASTGGVPQEVRITATVSWQTGQYQTRTFSISEDMYRWVNDDTAQ